MDNLDMAKLMNMLSKVDKKDLEKSMEIANKIMKSEKLKLSQLFVVYKL